MAKKFITIVLSLLLAIGAFALVGCDGGKEEGNGLIFTEQGNTYVVSGYEGEDASVIIPQTYKDKSVTKVAKNAFANKSIEEITIPSSIIEFGSDAFVSCGKLKKTTYLGSVDSWAEIKFANADANLFAVNYKVFT